MRLALVGASGLVGRDLAGLLATRGHEVHALVRRPATLPGVEVHVAAPSDWPARIADVRPQVLVSALGTTLRDAGSRAGFRAVDQHLLLAVAEAARQAGAAQCVAISSVGADPRSRNFYLRVKGEVEQSLVSLGFDRLDLLRPGLLIGDRTGRRPGERLAQRLAPLGDLLLRGSLDRYASIAASDVAKAAASLVGRSGPGVQRHHRRDLLRLAAGA